MLFSCCSSLTRRDKDDLGSSCATVKNSAATLTTGDEERMYVKVSKSTYRAFKQQDGIFFGAIYLWAQCMKMLNFLRNILTFSTTSTTKIINKSSFLALRPI